MEQLSIGPTPLWLTLVNTTLIFGMVVYVWFVQRRYDTAAMNHISDEVDNLERRLERIEEGLKHVPTQEQIRILHGDIQSLRSSLEYAQRDRDQLRRSLDVLNDYMMRMTAQRPSQITDNPT